MSNSRAALGEPFVPYARPPETVRPARSWRSTWVISSIQSLRERGIFAAYEALLPPEHKEIILTSVAGVWMPIELAAAHYGACDRLPIPNTERLAIGAAAVDRVAGTVLKTVIALAKNAGVTPWTLIEQATRLWERGADGGAVAVFKAGPKEAVIEAVGMPLFEIPYFRTAFTGVALGVLRLAATAYARELPQPARSAYRARFQWA